MLRYCKDPDLASTGGILLRSSDRTHWDLFWSRDRAPREIYGNDNRIAVETAARIPLEGALCLEVGAATARDSAALCALGAIAVALDYSSAALQLASRAIEGSGVVLVCGDAFHLPFREGTFDLVFSQGVLEHFRDPAPLLLESVRVLRPGASMLVDVPQTFHIYTLVKKTMIALGSWFAGWETQFTTRSLSRLLSDAGTEPFSSYGRFFSPSLLYRIAREVFLGVGLRLPMYPVLVPPVSNLRRAVRTRIEHTPVGTSLGSVIGVFARKPL